MAASELEDLEDVSPPALASVEDTVQQLHKKSLAPGPALSLAHDVFNDASHALHLHQGIQDLKDAEVGIKHDRIGQTFGMLAAYKQELLRQALLEQENQARAYLRKRRVLRLVKRFAGALLRSIGRTPGDMLGAEGAVGLGAPPVLASQETDTGAMVALVTASARQTPEPPTSPTPPQPDSASGRSSSAGSASHGRTPASSMPATPRDAPSAAAAAAGAAEGALAGAQAGGLQPADADAAAEAGDGTEAGGLGREASTRTHATSAAYDSGAESDPEDAHGQAPDQAYPHGQLSETDGGGEGRGGDAQGQLQQAAAGTAGAAQRRRRNSRLADQSGDARHSGLGVPQVAVWQKDGTPCEMHVSRYKLPEPAPPAWPPPYVKLGPGSEPAAPWGAGLAGGWNFCGGVLCSKPTTGGGGHRPGSPSRPVGGKRTASPPPRHPGVSAHARFMQLKSAAMVAGQVDGGGRLPSLDLAAAAAGEDGEEEEEEEEGEGQVDNRRVFLQVVATSYASLHSPNSTSNGAAPAAEGEPATPVSPAQHAQHTMGAGVGRPGTAPGVGQQLLSSPTSPTGGVVAGALGPRGRQAPGPAAAAAAAAAGNGPSSPLHAQLLRGLRHPSPGAHPNERGAAAPTSPERQRSLSPASGGGSGGGGAAADGTGSPSPSRPATRGAAAGSAATSRAGTPSRPTRAQPAAAGTSTTSSATIAPTADAALVATVLDRDHTHQLRSSLADALPFTVSAGSVGLGPAPPPTLAPAHSGASAAGAPSTPPTGAGRAGSRLPPPAPRPVGSPAAAPASHGSAAVASLIIASRSHDSPLGTPPRHPHAGQVASPGRADSTAAGVSPWEVTHSGRGPFPVSSSPSHAAAGAAGGSSSEGEVLGLGVMGASLFRPASQQQQQRSGRLPTNLHGGRSRSTQNLQGFAPAAAPHAADVGSSAGGALHPTPPMAVCGSPMSSARLQQHSPSHGGDGGGGLSSDSAKSAGPHHHTSGRLNRTSATAGRLVHAHGPGSEGGTQHAPGKQLLVLPALVKAPSGGSGSGGAVSAAAGGGLGSRPSTRGGAMSTTADWGDGSAEAPPAPGPFTFLKVL